MEQSYCTIFLVNFVSINWKSWGQLFNSFSFRVTRKHLEFSPIIETLLLLKHVLRKILSKKHRNVETASSAPTPIIEIFVELLKHLPLLLPNYSYSSGSDLSCLRPGADLGFSWGGADFQKIFEKFDDLFFFLGRSDWFSEPSQSSKKDPVLAKFSAPQEIFWKNRSKKPFLGTFWKNLTKKRVFFLARAPPQN